MVLLRSKEVNEKPVVRPRSGTFIVHRRRPHELLKSSPSTPVKEVVVEEWKRPGMEAPVLLHKDEETIVVPPKLESTRRRLWSATRSNGLREDLANNGSLESVIQMGNELLDELSNADSEEIAYREEQALFWYEKAAERGSSEAKDLIRQMAARDSSGINASNGESLKEALCLSDEELSGKRIGYLLFDSVAGSKEDSCILVGSLIGQCRLESEPLMRSELIHCGKEYMQGRLVPEVDKKLISAETRSAASLTHILLNHLALSLYYIQSLLSAYILNNIYLNILILVIAYKYWMFVSTVIVLQGSVMVLFLTTSFKLLQRPIEKRRFKAWTVLWETYSSTKSGISKQELTTASNNFNSNRKSHFALTASLTIGCVECLWGIQHPLTRMLALLFIPLLFLFELKWRTVIIAALIVLYCYTFEAGSVFEVEMIEECYIYIILALGSLVLLGWWKLGPGILSHLLLLKILDTLVLSSHFYPFSTSITLCVSLYYGRKEVSTKSIFLLLGILIGLSFMRPSDFFETPLSDTSLQKYTASCPSHFECSELEGLRVNWTGLEVIAIRQRLIIHPLNDLLSYISPTMLLLPLGELNVHYCDVSLVQEFKPSRETFDGSDERTMEQEEGLFSSFSFGSSMERPEGRELFYRKTIRARLWKTELCRSIAEGSVMDILGFTSSMTSDVDIIVYP